MYLLLTGCMVLTLFCLLMAVVYLVKNIKYSSLIDKRIYNIVVYGDALFGAPTTGEEKIQALKHKKHIDNLMNKGTAWILAFLVFGMGWCFLSHITENMEIKNRMENKNIFEYIEYVEQTQDYTCYSLIVVEYAKTNADVYLFVKVGGHIAQPPQISAELLNKVLHNQEKDVILNSLNNKNRGN